MNLAVSTRYGVWKVNTGSGKVTPLVDIGAPEKYMPFGITWNDKNMFVAVRGRPAGNPEFINVYNKRLELVTRIGMGRADLSDLHQILWHDGLLWIMSTGYNKVISWHRDGSFLEWDPNKNVPENVEDGGRLPRDWNHFNSIYFTDSSCYLAAHNFKRPAEIWQFSYPRLELKDIIPWGHEIHNVFKVGGKLYALESSGIGQEVRGGFKIPQFGYGRGFAMSERFFVGVSKREGDREYRRQNEKSSIFVFKGNYEFEKELVIDKGEIYEVRILDKPDKAHTGVPFL